MSSSIKQSELLQLIEANKYDSITRFLLKSIVKSKSYDDLVNILNNGIVNVHGNIAVVGI